MLRFAGREPSLQVKAEPGVVGRSRLIWLYGIAVLVAVSAAPVGDGVSYLLSTVGLDAVGAAAGLVVVLCAGAAVGWLLPGLRGFGIFAVGGIVGCLIATSAVVALTWPSAELLFGLSALIVANVAAVAIVGMLGLIYANVSGRLLKRYLRAFEVHLGQALGLLAIGALLLFTITARFPQQPRGLTIRNDTMLVLRIYEAVDGTWLKVGDQDLSFPGHQSVTFVPQMQPSAALAPGGLDGRGCTTRILVARTADGADVASHAAGFCGGDIWVIDGSSP